MPSFTVPRTWWKSVFNEKYLKTYADRTSPTVTKREVNFLLAKLPLKKSSRILDVACGYGRHALALAQAGYQVTGIDQSAYFIHLLKKDAKALVLPLQARRQDMRMLADRETYDVVLNLFTSFGYFSDAENKDVLLRFSRALKPRGYLLLDLNNPYRTIASLFHQAHGQSIKKQQHCIAHIQSHGLAVTTEHLFDPLTMRWSMRHSWKEHGEKIAYAASVRMYTFPELQTVLQAASLNIVNVWGDFDGSAINEHSPRMIVLARKTNGSGARQTKIKH